MNGVSMKPGAVQSPHGLAIRGVPAQKAKPKDDLEVLTETLLSLEHREQIGVHRLYSLLAAVTFSPWPPVVLDILIPRRLHLSVVLQSDRGILRRFAKQRPVQLAEVAVRVAQLVRAHPITRQFRRLWRWRQEWFPNLKPDLIAVIRRIAMPRDAVTAGFPRNIGGSNHLLVLGDVPDCPRAKLGKLLEERIES